MTTPTEPPKDGQPNARRSDAISLEWDAGWMMGFSFGALVVVIVHEFPHDFYDAAWPVIGVAGIATFVIGAARTRAIIRKRRSAGGMKE